MKSLVLAAALAMVFVGCGKEDKSAQGGSNGRPVADQASPALSSNPSSGGSCSEAFVSSLTEMAAGLARVIELGMGTGNASGAKAALARMASQCEAIVQQYGIGYSCSLPGGQVAEMSKLDTDCKKYRASSL